MIKDVYIYLVYTPLLYFRDYVVQSFLSLAVAVTMRTLKYTLMK